MITKFTIKNFKRIDDLELDLSSRVALVGPNNSGKTTLLQALTIWDIGLRKWSSQRNESKAKTRTGVTINRNDLLSTPIPSALLLWKDLHVRKKEVKENGKVGTRNIRFELCAEGVTNGVIWKVGLEFDYANTESLYCRILEEKTSQPFPDCALSERIGFLPPMSGLAPFEDRLIKDVLFRKIGEGRTSEVLRNLLWILSSEYPEKWDVLASDINRLFAAQLFKPILSEPGGILSMEYQETGGKKLDLSSAGRGFQQMLLILGFLYSGQNSILLLDEPDAHLEVLRQKEVYQFLSNSAAQTGSQIIIATHSETVLDEAAQTGQVIAFVGKPHELIKNTELKKSLNLIGYTDYVQAETYGKVVYLEGSTDLYMLRAFADLLYHPVRQKLDRLFVRYLSNNRPEDTYSHFFGLREAFPKLKGWALYDRIDKPIGEKPGLLESMWIRREFENYLIVPDVLYRWADRHFNSEMDLFHPAPEAMRTAVQKEIAPAHLEDPTDAWWQNEKMSNNILAPVFARYYKDLDLPVAFNKGDYYQLVQYMNLEEVDDEVREKLDSLLEFLNPEEAI
jgi:predicted ATPase